MTVTHWRDFYHGNAPITIEGAIAVKAGEGIGFTDPLWRKFASQAAAGAHHCMAYYALHTGSDEDMAKQAIRAAATIGTIPAWFDVERWPAESGSDAGTASLPQVLTAIDHYRRQGGIMHAIYLPRSVWEQQGKPSLLPLASRGIHIINADYRQGSETPGSAAWHPYGGVPVWSVQYAPTRDITASTWADAWSVMTTGTPVKATRT